MYDVRDRVKKKKTLTIICVCSVLVDYCVTRWMSEVCRTKACGRLWNNSVTPIEPWNLFLSTDWPIGSYQSRKSSLPFSSTSLANCMLLFCQLKGRVPFLQYMYNYRVTVRSVFCCTESKMTLAKGSVSSQRPLSVGVKGR